MAKRPSKSAKKPVSANAQRQQRLAAKRKAQGLVRSMVWIPAHQKERLKELVAEIQAGKNIPSPDAMAELENALAETQAAADKARAAASAEKARADKAENELADALAETQSYRSAPRWMKWLIEKL